MLEILSIVWKNKTTLLWIGVGMVLMFYVQKTQQLREENTHLTASLGAVHQQLTQQEAVIASLSSQKAIADEIAAKMSEGIAKNNNEARIALQKVLKASTPKDCVGSIEYLKSEAENVKFD